MFLADLHIHSRYSRATSAAAEPVQLELFARRKGLGLIASGDFTHAVYRSELREKLRPAEPGLYELKPELRLQDDLGIAAPSPRFIISGEISSIYKDGGKTRKIHNVVLLPSLEHADKLSAKLEELGCNLRADGRPIIGLSAHDLLELTLDVCPEAVFIPAHIWTPHFSLFGAYSGYDTIEECFRELTPHIHALETGLSSDPQMNRRISALDKYSLVSNSDAHSPDKLAREANIFTCDMSYPALAAAIADRYGDGLYGTIEFYPEEGKYHWDGHKDCKYSCRPGEAIANGNICPVCGKKLTYGVSHRVEELADRPEDFIMKGDRPCEKLAPLKETIAACMGMTTASKKVSAMYVKMMQELGPELAILRERELSDIAAAADPLIAEGISRMRGGHIELAPGYDGVYGKVRLFSDEEFDELTGQGSIFAGLGYGSRRRAAAKKKAEAAAAVPAPKTEPAFPYGLNEAQWQAAAAKDRHIAVLAGPGTGKTRTLICRILRLLSEGADPSSITAVTFTNKAARELKERLAAELPKKKLNGLRIGTFHSLALRELGEKADVPRLIDEFTALTLADEYLREQGEKTKAKTFLNKISRQKNGEAGLVPDELAEGWQRKLAETDALDFDDLLLRALTKAETNGSREGIHLLVDEFQDIDPLQFRLIQAWGAKAADLFIIGDPAQAIYGFRGSDPDCFRKFTAAYPDTLTVSLTENYRSTPNILAAALPLLAQDAPQLHSQKPSHAPVRLAETGTPLAEGIFIADEIDRMVGGLDMISAHKGKRPASALSLADIAVLYRTNQQGEQLAYCLETAGIPYTVSGREDYLADDEVRLCLTFFRSLLDKEDRPAAAVCRNRLGKEEAGLRKKFTPLLAKGKATELIGQWMDDRYLTGNENMEKLRGAALLCEDIRELLRRELLGKEGDMSRSGSREYVPEAVSLMTLHAAKGLEFPVVFLAGVKEGLIPLRMKGAACDEAEEKRLFYVGMTRAKDELILCSRPEESSFLGIIPQELLKREKPVHKHKIKIDQPSLF